MRLHKNRTTLRAATAVVAATAALGLGMPMASAAPPAPPINADVSNAEWLNPMCDVPSEHDPEVIKVIWDIGTERGVDDKTMLSAFEAGWVESHMNNLNCGDRDSLGVFQQRPSQGWCDNPDDCLDVEYATNSYFDQAIPNNENNPDYTAGELAQSVQRSAYPDRYDEAEAKAQELIEEASAASIK